MEAIKYNCFSVSIYVNQYNTELLFFLEGEHETHIQSLKIALQLQITVTAMGNLLKLYILSTNMHRFKPSFHFFMF